MVAKAKKGYTIESLMIDILVKILRCDFTGTAIITFYVEDGVITEINRKIEEK